MDAERPVPLRVGEGAVHAPSVAAIAQGRPGIAGMDIGGHEFAFVPSNATKGDEPSHAPNDTERC